MKRIFILILLLFSTFFFACNGEGGPGDSGIDSDPSLKTFSGKIEKGALQKGATITASEWSVANGYSGNVYTTETSDNLGGYSISSSALQGILDVRADGFFINENTGSVENTRIILSGLVDSSVSGQGNINIITHIIKQRVITLMTAGADFSTANNQAVTELYATLNWTPENPLNTSISENAKLLFLSAAICKNRSVVEVSALLTTLVNDMADGSIDISVLDDSFSLVDTAEVTNNITTMYGRCPDIVSVKAQVLAYRSLEDSTVRQITMIPVTTADFYIYLTNKSLRGFVSNQLQYLYVSYVQKYLGETTTENCIINDFFSITENGVKTLYFSVTFPYDSSTKLYSQTAGVMTEISALPDKPAIESFLFENLYYKLHVINGDTTEVWAQLTSKGLSRSHETVTGYYIADAFTHEGVSKGPGIFTVWSSGIITWLSENLTTDYYLQYQGITGRMW